MSRGWISVLLGACLVITACSSHKPASNGVDSSPAAQALRATAADLVDGRVRRIDFFFIPYETKRPSRVSPAVLEATATGKFSVEVTPAFSNDLARTINKMRVFSITAVPDLRWGLVFVDQGGQRLHTIYLDSRYILGTGRKGYVDGNLTGFNEALIEWLEKNYLR